MFSGKKFSAFLFDMDGTIVNSIAATERSWGAMSPQRRTPWPCVA
jgi:beta-phosphoglucomutase-like phosphatase (HAD superfamily)